jgi:hypothetical protein
MNSMRPVEPVDHPSFAQDPTERGNKPRMIPLPSKSANRSGDNPEVQPPASWQDGGGAQEALVRLEGRPDPLHRRSCNRT